MPDFFHKSFPTLSLFQQIEMHYFIPFCKRFQFKLSNCIKIYIIKESTFIKKKRKPWPQLIIPIGKEPGEYFVVG
jgi:hypothetical protein